MQIKTDCPPPSLLALSHINKHTSTLTIRLIQQLCIWTTPGLNPGMIPFIQRVSMIFLNTSYTFIPGFLQPGSLFVAPDVKFCRLWQILAGFLPWMPGFDKISPCTTKWKWDGFSSEYISSPIRYHAINSAYSFTHLSSKPNNVRN
jgi:hypothetical protein